jgi:hypothetical protein
MKKKNRPAKYPAHYNIVYRRWSVVFETLYYKPEGRGLDSLPSVWIFQLTWSFQPHYGPEVDSASNRNEYQESSWGKGRPALKADNRTVIFESSV